MSGIKGHFIGNLGKDPEDRTKDEKPMCKLRVATHRYKSGEEITQWMDVICFGKLSEQCMKHLSKGRRVHCEGRIDIDKGTENFEASLVMFANDIDFL
jgi:single-stranded DNA-binding protein